MRARLSAPSDWHDGILLAINATLPTRRGVGSSVAIDSLLYDEPEAAARTRYKLTFADVRNLHIAASIEQLADNAKAGNIDKAIVLTDGNRTSIWIYLMEGHVAFDYRRVIVTRE